MDVSLVNKVLCIMAHAQVSDKQRLVVYYPAHMASDTGSNEVKEPNLYAGKGIWLDTELTNWE